jgi:hypothetical protein
VARRGNWPAHERDLLAIRDRLMVKGSRRKLRSVLALCFFAAFLLLIVACGSEATDSGGPSEGFSGQQVAAAQSTAVEQPSTAATPLPATLKPAAAVESSSNIPPATAIAAGSESNADTSVAPTTTAGPGSESGSSSTAATATTTPGSTQTPVPATTQEPVAVTETAPDPGDDTPVLVNTRGPVAMLAPDFTLPSIEGPEYTLSDYRGKQPVLVVFYRAYW